MASPFHADPALLVANIPKTPGGDGGPTLGINLPEGEAGHSGPHQVTSFLGLGTKTPPTGGDDHRGKVTDLDGADLNGSDLDSADLASIREDTPGIDIINLPKTPLGTTAATARTDDGLNFKLALKPATTVDGLVRSLALGNVKEELCMSSAEWLRFQQEIVKFLDQGEWLYESYNEAAYAFLEGTGANERFFGILPGAEAEGMLINRGGLAWDLDNDRIIDHVATVVAAWKEGSAHSDEDTEEDFEEPTSPAEILSRVRPTQQKPQLEPQIITMLPRDIIDECMVAFPVTSTRQSTRRGMNSSDENKDGNEGSRLFVTQYRTSVKRVPRSTDTDDGYDDDGNKAMARGNKRRRGMTETPTPSFTARPKVSAGNPGPQLFFNRAWPTLIGDTPTGPQLWTNPKPSLPDPWLPSTLHIHGVQRGPMKLLPLNSIMTLDGLLYQFRNAFRREMSDSTVTNKCQIVRRIRVYHKLPFDTIGSRIKGNDAQLWKETMEEMQKKISGKESDRISGSVEIHF